MRIVIRLPDPKKLINVCVNENDTLQSVSKQVIHFLVKPDQFDKDTRFSLELIYRGGNFQQDIPLVDQIKHDCLLVLGIFKVISLQDQQQRSSFLIFFPSGGITQEQLAQMVANGYLQLRFLG